DAGTFKTLAYALLTSDLKVTPDSTKRGFLWRVHQNSSLLANNSARPIQQLGGLLGENFADPNAQGVAIAPGTPGSDNRQPIQFEIDSVINMSQNAADGAGDFPSDDIMPGIPGVNPSDSPTAATDGIAGEVITYIDLPAGKHTFAVRSDDGFRTTAGNIADVFKAQVSGDSAGAVANSTYDVYVQEAGVYPFRTVWEEGSGGANIEWMRVLADGTTRVLLNDTANGGFTTYRAVTGKGPTAITLVSPVQGATAVPFDTPVMVKIQEGTTALDAASVTLRIDGAVVNAQKTKVGDVTTVTYQPSEFFASGSQHTAAIAYTAGGVPRSETWQFTVATYPTLTRAQQAASVDTSKPGFVWSVFQNETYTPNSLAEAELALAGQLTATAGGPVLTNLAEPTITGPALVTGVKTGAVYRFDIPTVINLSQTEFESNGYFTPDEQMPGIPGTTFSTDGIDAEVITFVELPAGVVTFGVVSDDSYRIQAGNISKPSDAVLLSQVDGATANLTFRCWVKDAGVYPIRVVWQEWGGAAHPLLL
ncbi:MAG TPA: hypothetical protein VHO48_06100, partial [Anaerolineaceae bacterium]|nr:hypothetical protein [Anaerolineaceae bacterium]